MVPALGGAVAGGVVGLVAARLAGPLAGGAAGVAVWALVVAWSLRRPLRRLALARRPLAAAWRAWLVDHVPTYAALDPGRRRAFERDVAWLMDGLTFEAAGGAELTDPLRLAVAAGGAVLLHGHPDWELPTERTVLLVPDTFDEAYGDEEPGMYDGMVHSQGPVVLSVRAVERGWDRRDGHNVVLHELAHVFDFEGWEADGVPSFIDPRSADAWRRLVKAEMRRAQRGDGVLRSYAGTAPAELFAVATEQFFRAARPAPPPPPGAVRRARGVLQPDAAGRARARPGRELGGPALGVRGRQRGRAPGPLAGAAAWLLTPAARHLSVAASGEGPEDRRPALRDCLGGGQVPWLRRHVVVPTPLVERARAGGGGRSSRRAPTAPLALSLSRREGGPRR